MMPVKADLVIFVTLLLVCLDSARVWLSCQAIIGISILAGLFWVLQIQPHLWLRIWGIKCIMVLYVRPHVASVLLSNVVILIVLQGDEQRRVSDCQAHTAVFLPRHAQTGE